jgi:transcription antitermination factor NusG
LPRNDAHWFVLWTHSNSERLVHAHLRDREFEVFLPLVKAWSRRRGVQSTVALPMFPGYVFVRHVLDKRSYVEILKARGVVRVLGERWDRPAFVPDGEIEAIRRVAGADVPVLPYPFLTEGQRVRIEDGPLTGLQGILIATKPQKGLLVVSVDLLQRSVAVEVASTQVQPLGPAVVRPYTPMTAGAASLRGRA